jgi:hypothetical protein
MRSAIPSLAAVGGMIGAADRDEVHGGEFRFNALQPGGVGRQEYQLGVVGGPARDARPGRQARSARGAGSAA